MRVARTLHAVGREVLEPSSAAFQAAATPSQLPAQQKNPVSLALVTPGFFETHRDVRSSVTTQRMHGQGIRRSAGVTPCAFWFAPIIDLNEVIAFSQLVRPLGTADSIRRPS